MQITVTISAGNSKDISYSDLNIPNILNNKGFLNTGLYRVGGSGSNGLVINAHYGSLSVYSIYGCSNAVIYFTPLYQ